MLFRLDNFDPLQQYESRVRDPELSRRIFVLELGKPYFQLAELRVRSAHFRSGAVPECFHKRSGGKPLR